MMNIFVGNLAYQAIEQELQAMFAGYGAVERVNLIRDRDTGQPRGFAFVEMASREEGMKAIQGLERPGSTWPRAQRERGAAQGGA